MKTLIFSLFIILLGCSTSPEKKSVPKLSPNAFKKEKPLSNTQVADYYPDKAPTLTPALQDETLQRYSKSEIEKVKSMNDPLVNLSIFCSQKKFKEAFSLASNIFSKYQKVTNYWNQVANCHLRAGSHRKALLFYNKALEIQSENIPALNNIGVMYTMLGQDQKAQVAFEKALRQSKFSKTPRYNLARIYLKYGLVDLAQPLIQGLLNESSNDVDLLNAMANIYFLKSNYQKAMDYYQQIPPSEWRRPEIGLNLSYNLKLLGKGRDALKVLNSVSNLGDKELKEYYASVRSVIGEGN